MSELVPDTPRATAEVVRGYAAPSQPGGIESYSQSYLLDALGGGDPTGSSRLPHATDDAVSQRREPSPREASDKREQLDGGRASIAASRHLSLRDESGVMQGSFDVYKPPAKSMLLRTRSALVLGPDDRSGYSDVDDDLGDLGETQAAHSLNEDSWRLGSGRRLSKEGHESDGVRQDHAVTEEDRSGGSGYDMSMDLTRAVGRVLPSHEDQPDARPPAATHVASPESQKENPSPLLVPTRPQGHPPFSLSAHSNFDVASPAPPSSLAVARGVPQRRSSNKAAALDTNGDADTVPSTSSSPRSAAVIQPVSGTAGEDTTVSPVVPKTSTPAFSNVPPPAPNGRGAHTLPLVVLADGALDQPSSPHRPSSAISPARRGPFAVNSEVFASSAAMKASIPIKRKRKAEPWDGLSQSDESTSIVVQAQDGVDSVEEPVAILVHNDPAPDTSQISKSDSNLRDGRERTTDLGGGTSKPTAYKHDTPGGASSDNLVPAPLSSFAHMCKKDRSPRGAFDPSDFSQNAVANVPVATESSTSSSPASRSPLKASGPNPASKKRLSDIAELKSSIESSSQVIEVPATQLEYDALAPAESAHSSLKTQDVQIDNSSRWHASFQHDTSTDTAATRRHCTPAPGRELKRPAPSPTPGRTARVAAGALNTTATASRNELRRQSQSSERGADLSTLPQATQQAPVPKSSPEVPLARTHSSRHRSLPMRHTLPEHIIPAMCMEIVVPDSDGPTQEETFVASSSRHTQASRKAYGRSGPREEMELAQQEGPASCVKMQEFYQGAHNGDENMRDVHAHAIEATQDVQAQDAATSYESKSQNNIVLRRRDAPKYAVPKAVPAPLVEGRCTRKAPRPSLPARETAPGESLVALDHLQETNYSSDPAARKPQPRPARSIARTRTAEADKRNQSAGPTSRPGLDEDGKAVSASRASPRKKRKVVTSPIAQVSAARSSACSSPCKKSMTSSRKGIAAKTMSKDAVRSSQTDVKLAAAVSPETPVAGPSRPRIRVVARTAPARTVSPALSADVKPAVKSRLVPSAPFTRVLAFWRDGDVGYYPGTVVAFIGGKFDVRFDDGSRGKILPDEIRHCELVKGDRVTTFGYEPDGDIQRMSLDRDFVVTAIEHRELADAPDQKPLKSGEGFAAHDTLVLVDEGRTERVPVSAIRVCPRHGRQLDDRRLTGDELALFEGKERPTSAPLQRLNLLKLPKPPAVEPIRKVTGPERDRLFGRIAFIVTASHGLIGGKHPSALFNRHELVQQLEDHGATIIDWQHLLQVKQSARDDSPPEVVFRASEFAPHVKDIFLLTNRACQTSKYLVSLALGIPCLSKEFAVQSLAASVLLDWRPFLLSAGFLHDLGTYGLGSQLRAQGKTEYGLRSLAEMHARGGVLQGKTFVVVMRKGDKSKTDNLEERSYTVLALLACASARLVHFVESVDDARAASGYDFVFIEDDSKTKLPRVLKSHKGLVNMVWLKQCIMTGRLLSAERMRQMEE